MEPLFLVEELFLSHVGKERLVSSQTAHATYPVKVQRAAGSVNSLITIVFGSPFTCQVPGDCQEAIMRKARTPRHAVLELLGSFETSLKPGLIAMIGLLVKLDQHPR